MVLDDFLGLIFSICVIWLFITKWILAPEKEKIPVPMQSLALLGLCSVWVFMLEWVPGRFVNLQRAYERLPVWVNRVLYFYLPLAIGILGVRFCWNYFPWKKKPTIRGQFFYLVGAFLTLAALASAFSSFLSPIQKVREAALFAEGAFFR
jgi:hypothetical protein